MLLPFVFLLSFSANLYSQGTTPVLYPPSYCDEEPNVSLLENYWNSREVMTSQFMANNSLDENGNLIDDGIGVFDPATNAYTHAGNGLPARRLEMRFNGTGNDNNLLVYADTPIQLGMWIANLAMEYKLLGDNGQEELQQKTANELFLALQAYRRLDLTAQKLFELHVEAAGWPIGTYPNACPDYLSGYTGWFLRDDVPSSHQDNFTNPAPDWQVGGIKSDFLEPGDPVVNYFFDNLPSIDQVTGLLFGLSFVEKFIPNSVTASVNGETYNLRQMAIDIACGLVGRIIDSPFHNIRRPSPEHCICPEVYSIVCDVPRGEDASSFLYGMIQAANKIGCNFDDENELLWEAAVVGILDVAPTTGIGDNPDNVRMMLSLMAAAGGDPLWVNPYKPSSTFIMQDYAYTVLFEDDGPFGPNPPAPPSLTGNTANIMESILCEYNCPGPCNIAEAYANSLSDSDPTNDFGPSFTCNQSTTIWCRDKWIRPGCGDQNYTNKFSPLSYMIAFNLYQLSGNSSNPNYYNPFDYELNANIESSNYDNIVTIDGPNDICSSALNTLEISEPDGSCWQWSSSANVEIVAINGRQIEIKGLYENEDGWIEATEICGEFDGECATPRTVRKNLKILDLCTFLCLRDGDIHVTTDMVIDTDIGLRAADIYVHSGAELRITATVKFNKDRGIIVERGGKLHLDGGTLTRCDAPFILDPASPYKGIQVDEWRGIYVEGNPAQPDQSGQVIVTNGRIEWARNAISTSKLGEHSNADYWGGQVHCTGSIFYNNHRSAEFMKYDAGGNGSFTGCNFINDYDDAGSTGVTIWASDGIVFDNCRFIGMELSGIRIWDAACTITNSEFNENGRGVESFATSPSPTGSEMYITDNCRFNDNFYHVYASSDQLFKNLIITGNTFNQGRWDAIVLAGPNSTTISENSFNDVVYGITCGETTNGFNDIYCNAFNQLSVSDAVGITASGDNSRTRITRNVYETGWMDHLLVFDANITPAAIHPMQEVGGAPADNCFTDLHDNHFVTLDPTISFDYYIPTTNPSNCQIPRLGTGSNNFSTVQATDPVTFDCPNFFTDCPPSSVNDFIAAKQLHQNLVGQLDLDPGNAILKKQTLAAEEEKEKILSCIIKNALNSGIITDAETALLSDGSTSAMKRLFGLKLQTNDYDGATSLLSHPVLNGLDNINNQNFVRVQQINLQRLNSGAADFHLSADQELFLEDLADSPSESSNYAKGLLSLLKERAFVFEHILPDLGGDQPNLMIPENNDPTLSVFPNPSSGMVSVSLPKYFDEEVRISIFSLSGVTVGEFIFKEGKNLEIDARSYPEGVYVIKVIAADELIGQKKIVLTK